MNYIHSHSHGLNYQEQNRDSILMEALVSSTVSNPQPATLTSNRTLKTHFKQVSFHPRPRSSRLLVGVSPETQEKKEEEEEVNGKRRFKWARIGPNITEAQKESIAELSRKMTKRCKAVMKQIICFHDERASLSELLSEWVRIMKPQRADWLVILKHLKTIDHPFYLQVAEIALGEESFEANIRDYTKMIHSYGKQNRVRDAENALAAMKSRGLVCDQVTLTALIDMYSKAGELALAEQTFEELKLLGEPLDKRSYGSMTMAYVRAGAPHRAESLLREMDSLEVRAGSEVYKAVLRAYSAAGDADGAQRVFDAVQLALIAPDARMCGLLINACASSGESERARSAFENMRAAGVDPTDKCVALVLSAYERVGKVQSALEFLAGLERDGFLIGREASETLAGWFRKLGVVKEVDLVLREFADLSVGT